MSLDILLGYTGLASLGQAAYLGVGAYLTAILATRYQFGLGWDFWLVLVFGILAGAALAAVFGLLAIRASGTYFLMITLALGQCVWGLAYRWNSLTGGDNGINLRAAAQVRHRPVERGDVLLSGVRAVRGLAAGDVRAGALAVRAQPDWASASSELRMKILGYNTWLHKYIAFIIAGAFGGLVRRAVGAYRRHRQPGERGAHHLGRRAADGGARRRGHAGRRRDRLVHRVRASRISQHAGAVVAVRAGRRLRADDPLPADRADGHSGANPAAPQHGERKAEDTKKLATAPS